MSISLMKKAWETDLKGNEKLVLLSLADNASDEGYCWPSWDKIIKKTNVSKGTLSKILNTLESKNLIKRISRKRENGSSTSNGYYVLENTQSSEVEHQGKVQKLNYQSSEVEHLESSYNHQCKKNKQKKLSPYEQFIGDLKKKVPIPSKVTSTEKGKEMFKQVVEVEKLMSDYVDHQKDELKFSTRITSFMEDWLASSRKSVEPKRTYTQQELIKRAVLEQGYGR